MRRSWTWGLVALLLMGAGVALVLDAVLHGAGTAGVFVVFPFVYGSSPALALGVIALFAGLVALSIASAHRWEEQEEERPVPPATPVPAPLRGGSAPAPAPSTSYGGFLLIGPVPVVFGNRPAWFPYLVALALTTVIAILILVLLWIV